MWLIIKKFLAQVILMSDEEVSFVDKIQYSVLTLIKLSPIAFVLNGLSIWFNDNKLFFSFVIYTLIANIGFGVWRHKKERSFSWEKFFEKNFQMWIIIILTYPLLEMIRIITGDNLVSEIFTIGIQISTLLYPGSKVLKNVYIISNKEFPPRYVMERLYKFEKTGNPDILLNKEHTELTDEEKKDFEDNLK